MRVCVCVCVCGGRGAVEATSRGMYTASTPLASKNLLCSRYPKSCDTGFPAMPNTCAVGRYQLAGPLWTTRARAQ